ncbi:MAG TPA: hypothetical protein VM889_09195 [Candidatus Thermoplasmatota archaeon]|nr:hypothetical protein [Candidatus Thermoplasmatota archaeon]
MRRALPVVIVLLIVAPAVEAQADDLLPFELAVAPFDGPIPPLAPMTRTAVLVTVSCARLVGHSVAYPMDLTFSIESAPAWALASVNPTRVPVGLDACDAATRTARFTASMGVVTLPEAPAFEAGDITLRATLRGVAETTTREAIVSLSADWAPLLSVVVDAPARAVVGGETAEFVFTATNRGNAPVVVASSVENATRSWNATGLGTAAIEPGASARFHLRVDTPSDVPTDAASYTVAFAWHLEADPRRANEPVLATVLVSVRSGSVAGLGEALEDTGTLPLVALLLPAPAPLALALALASAAAAFRRRP